MLTLVASVPEMKGTVHAEYAGKLYLGQAQPQRQAYGHVAAVAITQGTQFSLTDQQ